MRHTRLLFRAVLAALLMMTTMQAQLKIGLSAGVTNNSLETSSLYRSFEEYNSQQGFTIAIPLQYYFTDWFALGADVSYIQKNYLWKRNDIFSGIYQQTRNGYFQVPLMTHFSFGNQQVKGFVNAGGYLGYWASSRIKGQALNIFDFETLYAYQESYDFNSKRDNRWEAGLLAGIGLEYAINTTYSLFVEARYFYGLTDLQKNYMVQQIPRYNSTVAIQVGCLVQLSDFFKK